MPFDKLTSDESQFRLAVCRPHGAFKDATAEGGVPTYAHATGFSHFKARSVFQLSSMMGFLLNRNDGSFMKAHLSETEMSAVHECLQWGRQPEHQQASGL